MTVALSVVLVLSVCVSVVVDTVSAVAVEVMSVVLLWL